MDNFTWRAHSLICGALLSIATMTVLSSAGVAGVGATGTTDRRLVGTLGDTGVGDEFQDSACEKVRVCSGIAPGACVAQGMVCHSDSCHPGGLLTTSIDPCSWEYSWGCYPAPTWAKCVVVMLDEWGHDCGMNCRLVSYNLCGCECRDLGFGSFEAGRYLQCATVGE